MPINISSIAISLSVALSAQLFAELSEKEMDIARAKLNDFNQLVGKWNSMGAMRVRVKGKPSRWHNTVEWNWYFTDDNVGLTAKFGKGSLYFKEGLLTYDPAKQNYLFIAKRQPDGAKITFKGKLEKDTYVLRGMHPKTKKPETLKLKMIHYNAYIWFFEEGRRLLARVSCTVEGGFRAADQGPKCVVTGGLGTTTVQFEGENFYVCCSGCMDAWKKNPAKYVAEFKAKQKEAANN